MFDLGMQELIVIFVVSLLVFGPKRLPELSRAFGKGMRELKIALRGVQESMEEVEKEVSEDIKDVKAGVEESIYKGIQPDLSSEESKKGDAETKEGQKISNKGEEGKKEKADEARDG